MYPLSQKIRPASSLLLSKLSNDVITSFGRKKSQNEELYYRLNYAPVALLVHKFGLFWYLICILLLNIVQVLMKSHYKIYFMAYIWNMLVKIVVWVLFSTIIVTIWLKYVIITLFFTSMLTLVIFYLHGTIFSGEWDWNPLCCSLAPLCL